MINYYPNPILLKIGPIKIYWYGFFIVLGAIIALFITKKLLKNYKEAGILKDHIAADDLMIYLLAGGLIGARIFHVIAEWKYYISRPLDIFKVWNGGLWIYGALFGGICGLILFLKKKEPSQDGIEEDASGSVRVFSSSVSRFSRNLKFMLDILAPAIIFAQAVGRWGNYFNQELYGLPSNLPWAISIDKAHRVAGFMEFTFFHPVFLYESLWCSAVGIILLCLHKKRLALLNTNCSVRRYADTTGDITHIKAAACAEYGKIFLWYLFLYSLGRFCFEFIRIDAVPLIFGIRITQIAAGIVLLATGWMILKNYSTGLFKLG